LNNLWDQISNNFFYSSLYDIVKFFISYLIARQLYDRWYKKIRWGGWETVVVKGDEELTRRKMLPDRAEMVNKDDTELSVYIKGIVSPHAWLTIDVCSEQAKQMGLLSLNRDKRRIVIDLAKNPPGKARCREENYL
jgi:hypothetical protein